MSTVQSGARSVVVGVDLVRGRDNVIDRSSRLPLCAGARVTLIHVLSHDAPEAASDDSLAGLRALGATLLARRPDVALDVVVRRGDPATQLVQFVDEEQPELLVVGRGTPRGLLGMSRTTIAERVAWRSDVPVLAVQSRAASLYRRFVVAIESPGEQSSRSVETARRLLGEECEINVVHALDGAIERRMHRGGAPHYAILTARRWFRSRVRAEISAWLGGRLRARRMRVWLETGDPSRVILDLAGRTKPDLLVVSADRQWLRRILRPSVAGLVLARAECDVLIVRSGKARAAAARSTRAA